MRKQLTFPVGDIHVKVFLEDGFFPDRIPTGPLHKHWYPEIHWIMEGSARYQIDQRIQSASAGQVFLIPKHTFHCCLNSAEGTKRIAFQADIPEAAAGSHVLSAKVVQTFFPDWESFRTDQGTGKLMILLQLLCALFVQDAKVHSLPIQDTSLIVEEFFSRRYHEEVTLKDLANDLMLSEKQTQRLVVKQTGHTFRKELTARRMEVVQQLLQTGNYTLAQAAEYVGYRSYSGFWKACRQAGFSFRNLQI